MSLIRMIKVDSLPLNCSGKLDRPLLSSAEFFHEATKDIAPRVRQAPSNSQEEAVEDSLFDLGGHSLMATAVITAIRRELGTNLSMASFFRHPTVKASPVELLKQTVFFNSDHPGPTLFMFPETTGFGGVYSSAVGSIDAKIVAFGDEGWGNAGNDSNDTIESIGKTLVQKILQKQSTGPFWLAGALVDISPVTSWPPYNSPVLACRPHTTGMPPTEPMDVRLLRVYWQPANVRWGCIWCALNPI
ncbi:hypothetical protein M422DRAFT_268494 [Sphaerobolus stellatus SS14]|uniref:Carrier domain-containing protein n=1 Tax=Sphaerobolus stellatus (strain SS14) TaxID=990650 RepID=A0A0C9TK01_SPHS4|nr:hypothetical protein M422DRAFT_268494 [Sphaerobolus stellatus SS14]